MQGVGLCWREHHQILGQSTSEEGGGQGVGHFFSAYCYCEYPGVCCVIVVIL